MIKEKGPLVDQQKKKAKLLVKDEEALDLYMKTLQKYF